LFAFGEAVGQIAARGALVSRSFGRNVKRTRALWLSLWLAIPTSLALADWRLEGETGVTYESNLSASDRASDREADWAWTTHLLFGNGWQLSRDLRLNLSAAVRGQLWNEFDGFNAIGGGAVVTLRYRFGLGSRAPWLSLEERLGYNRFSYSSQSNWDESLRFRAGIAISSRLVLEAGYGFENLAAPNDFYDLQGHRADVRLIVELTPSWQVALGSSYREGDVISYAVPPRPDILAIAQVRPGVPVFGATPLYNAYRLRGRTHAVSFVTSYNLTRYLSLQASYEYGVTLHDPLRYENHRFQAQFALAY
jgi:hypothetical protein